MGKTFHIRSGLEPSSLENINSRHYNFKKQEPITSILSEYIKILEEGKTLAEDRRHVGSMLPFDGNTELAMKCGDYGFFTAIYHCYNHHWGLKTIPDDWWYTIIRTVAIAIDKHSKEDAIRKFFVDHEGKKQLTVYVNPCKIDYASFYRQMTNLIQSNIKVENYVNTVRSNFSTSTDTHRIVSEITIMSSMQEFFEYRMATLCGIPFVEMEGTEEDWLMLKSKLIELKKMLQPIHEKIGLNEAWWMKVEMICDKLIETYRDNGDKEWWSKIFSSHHSGFGSGGSSVTYDGWFVRDLMMLESGKSFRSIPSGLVSVPLTYDNNGIETKGAIVSGIAGIQIDESNEVPVVSSVHGWAIFR